MCESDFRNHFPVPKSSGQPNVVLTRLGETLLHWHLPVHDPVFSVAPDELRPRSNLRQFDPVVATRQSKMAFQGRLLWEEASIVCCRRITRDVKLADKAHICISHGRRRPWKAILRKKYATLGLTLWTSRERV